MYKISNNTSHFISLILVSAAFAPVVLAPGANLFTPKQKDTVDELLKDESIKAKLKKGELTFEDLTPSVEPEEAKEGILALNAKNAINLVKETYDIEKLKEYEDIEERSSVMAAIQKQKDQILNSEAFKEPEDKEEVFM